MERRERLEYLTKKLARERGLSALPGEKGELRRILRGLMNLRPPASLDPAWLAEQDRLLSTEREERGVVKVMDLPVLTAHPRISLWQGDITRLKADAIVNAANAALLGCFCPCHGCIDNAIHSAAGLQLREECARIMGGREEKNGGAVITKGYNLPAKYVLHTVGPIISDPVTEKDREELRSCYRSCLRLAVERGLGSVAFCCISTGGIPVPPNGRRRRSQWRRCWNFWRGSPLCKGWFLMCFRTGTGSSAGDFWEQTGRAGRALAECDWVLIGAGAGLSASAGFDYAGDRFRANFGEFEGRCFSSRNRPPTVTIHRVGRCLPVASGTARLGGRKNQSSGWEGSKILSLNVIWLFQKTNSHPHKNRGYFSKEEIPSVFNFA